MSWALIRAALATRIDAVSGIENVHEYLRFHAKGLDDPTFLSQLTVASGNYAGKQELNNWQITRTAVAQEPCLDSDDTTIRRHSVEVQGFLSFDDANASENTFNGLVDAILTDLSEDGADRTLGATAHTHGLPQVAQITTATYLGLLCHVARITMEIEELIS